MKKSLLGFEQITRDVVLYPETKFKLISPAQKLANAIDFEAQIKRVLVKSKLRFQSSLDHVSRIY